MIAAASTFISAGYGSATRCERVSGVDLRDWIRRDHAFVNGRFDSAIVRHVPADLWRSPDVDQDAFGAQGSGPCIAWLLFHMTYHQDLALNTAIRNHPPLLTEHRYELGLAHLPPAAGLTEAEDREVTDVLNLGALHDYVSAVNHMTQEWIDKLSVMALDSVPANSYRLAHLAGIPADGDMEWLHAMWDAKPVSWLVQWECIGHGHAHVGEMVGIRNRLGLSPF